MNDIKREIEKRMNAALDLIQWLDHRIAQQVEHQFAQRIAQEREYLRCALRILHIDDAALGGAVALNVALRCR